MKKIIGLLLVLSVFCPLGINVFAQDTLDGKITLTHFLGVDEDNVKTVTLSYGGNTYTVDKAKFLTWQTVLFLHLRLTRRKQTWTGFISQHRQIAVNTVMLIFQKPAELTNTVLQ